MKKNIAVIAGGDSAEDVISLQSGDTVLKNLDPEQYNPFLIVIRGNNWIVKRKNAPDIAMDKNDFSFNTDGQKTTFDCAFIAIHGKPGEDGKLQGYLEMMGVPYTTCDVFVSALTFNKYACNQLLKRFDVLSAESILVTKHTGFEVRKILDKISTPCFIKPNNGGSSFGVSKVNNEKELGAALQKALEHDDEIIVEKFIKGRELTCGVALMNEEIAALPITEIISKNEFFDYQAKYDGASEEITPAKIPAEVERLCKETSVKIFRTLNCRGVVRIDYIYCEDKLYLLEVNTVPGLSGASIVPQQVRAMGITLKDFFSTLVETAIMNKIS